MYTREKPGIRRRVSAAIDVFLKGYPRLRSAVGQNPKAQVSSTLRWPKEDIQPMWHLVDFQTYVEEGVNLNAVIYSALRYKWQSTSAAPLRAYTGDPEHPTLLPETHPLTQLVTRPNPWQDWASLQGQADAFLNIIGNAYFWLDRPKPGALPTAIYCPRPDKIFIIPTSDEIGRPSILGYFYIPDGKPWKEGIPILPEDMMHVKLFNPLDPMDGLGEGLSPLSSAAYSIDVDNSVTRFLKLFFERGGVPPYFFTFDMPVDDGTLSQLQTRIQEMYGGGDNWIKPGVLGSGGKIERVGMTFTEMGFSDLDERNEARILGPLGVPPILVGTRFGLKRATYANYGAARAAFWEDVMKPELMLFSSVFQKYLYTDDGGFVKHDYTSVPAFQKDLPKLIDAAWKLWSMGVPSEIAFSTVGVPVAISDVPDSEVAYIPLNVYPVGDDPFGPNPQEEEEQDEPEEEEEPSNEEDEEDEAGLKGEERTWNRWRIAQLTRQEWKADQGLTDRAKENIGRQYQAIAKGWERRMSEAARKQLGRDYVGLKATLVDYEPPKAKGDIQWDEISTSWDQVLLDAKEEWRTTFIPYMQGVMEDQGAMYSAAFGAAFDIRLIHAENWFDDYTMKFAAETIGAHERELAEILKQAQANGWSIPATEAALADTFDAWISGNPPSRVAEWIDERQIAHRRNLIARTEIIRSSAAGANALFGSWGVDSKEWLTTRDDRTCPWCREMSGKLIPIGGTYFEQGEKLSISLGGTQRTMSFNYGSVPYPPLHPLCRCALLPYKSSWGAYGVSPIGES